MKTKTSYLAIMVAFLIATSSIKAQVCFSPATNFAVGWSPRSIINADFNKDGNTDLATANSGSDNVSVLFGNGTGGFASAINFPAGTNPYSITSADFNGDGNIDLATANLISNNISVLLGDGLGGFGSATNFTTGTYPASIISSDFNGDGKPDLAVANYSSNNISVLIGDGMGGFNTTTNIIGVNPTSIISGDFNGDSKIDLVVLLESSDIFLLLGDGIGNFGTPTIVSSGSNLNSWSIISADFNGDSKIDLAVANGVGSISILLGDGIGGFGNAINFAAGNNPSSIICADLNGDNKLDLAISDNNLSNASILLGDGLGSFGIATNFTVGGNPRSIISSDFNGDGKKDLAIGNDGSGVSILLNNPFHITANASITTVCLGTSVILSGSGATSYTWSDGVNDGISFVPTSTQTYTVTGTITGCSATATKTITVNPLPAATFTIQNESSSLYCDGSIVANIIGAGTIQKQWLDSAQTVLASIDSIGALCHGIYTLHITDANSCANTYTKTIQAGQLPPTPPICLITVINNHNLLAFEKTNLNMTTIDSFIVYREFGTNNYQRIGVIAHDSISTFTDFISNPSATGYRYKLKSKSFHNVTSAFSDYHNTIYLTNTGGNFNWTQYQIENNTTPVSTYNVLRDDNSTGNFQVIGFTSGNQFGYTDVNFSSYPNASYYVEAVMTSGDCHPTRSSINGSISNIKQFGTTGVDKYNYTKSINIYPNPVSDSLHIDGIVEKTTLSLYDIVGKLVFKNEVESNTSINTSDFAKGIYTLIITGKSGWGNNTIVINH